MIEFKRDFEKLLPYDRSKYIDFLEEPTASSIKWYGVSFQLRGDNEWNKINLEDYVESYEYLFKNVAVGLDNDSLWIVNHDDKDLMWFPNDADNLTRLRDLFRENNVPNTFTGALIFSTDELLTFSKDLITYPYVVLNKDGFLYKDLDVSHSELKFIIKISGHLNIDFLTTEKEIIKEFLQDFSSSPFIIKQYRSNSSDLP